MFIPVVISPAYWLVPLAQQRREKENKEREKINVKITTREDAEKQHIENLKNLGFSDHEIPKILERERIGGMLVEDAKARADDDDEEDTNDEEWDGWTFFED